MVVLILNAMASDADQILKRQSFIDTDGNGHGLHDAEDIPWNPRQVPYLEDEEEAVFFSKF